MNMRVAAMPVATPRHGWLFLPLLLALALAVPGCSLMPKKPSSDIVLAMPVQAGTVMQVDTPTAMGREVRDGDIAITVNLDSGGSVIVIQPEDNIFTPGDRVRVVRSGETFVRVQVLTPAP